MSKERSRRQTVMRHIFTFFTFVAATAVITSCSDELFLDEPTPFTVVGETVDVDLALSVSDLSIEMTTRAEVPEATDGEKKINDVWVFQYDQSTKYLIQSRYYEVSEDDEIDENSGTVTLHIKLNDNNGSPCIVYVVANTGNENWAASATSENTSSGFYTLDELKKHTIPNAAPIRIDDLTDDGSKSEDNLSIPMGGSLGEDGDLTISGGPDETIEVPVTRMFAKLYVTVKLNPSTYNAEMTGMTIDKIPDFCTVGTVYENDTWYYPTSSAGSVFDVSRTFTSDDVTADDSGTKSYGPFVLYVPENLQGTSTTDAIKITPNLAVQMSLEDGNGSTVTAFTYPSYTAYPGSWNYTTDSQVSTNDSGEKYGESLDIRRNNIYDITLTINIEEYPVQPSANCLIAKPGETIAFYPYVRDEEMSPDLATEAAADDDIAKRYTFATYLNSSYTEGDQTKKIKSVKIIWQSPQDFIGDNSNFDLVTIDPGPDDTDKYGTDLTDEEKSVIEYHRKIYVQTKSAGNALIAAYDDYEGNGSILWSWHIWAPNEGVDPETGAIEYYHYQWDSENGINTDLFVPGRLVMNLNLGALKENPSTEGMYDFETYGTIYQWGRKDPFPPTKIYNTTLGTKDQAFFNYADYTVGAYNVSLQVYNNEDVQENNPSYDGSMSTSNSSDLFYTNAPSNVTGGTLGTTDNEVIMQSVKHPTMFIASSSKALTIQSGTDFFNNVNNYFNEGDWMPVNDDFLWGGGHPSNGQEFQVYSKDSNSKAYDSKYPSINAYLEDDFGPNKTIFDPCPYGWRVSPGDIWLGFTKNGKNWRLSRGDVIDDINCFETYTNPDEDESLDILNCQNGFTFYMQGWHGSIGQETSFFPTQGSRIGTGQPYQRGGICGNYHNATVDKEMEYTANGSGNVRRVDILHLHATISDPIIKPFTDELYYYMKSVAGPLRCVRDTK